ncbi:MAG: zinc ribbon domain-containing protein [Deltaproteobacteria bacterium]|nr:zinc ribbon domain-containing protein [Deltaproteobacteria bacterium]
MKCPYCLQKLPWRECPACGFEIPAESKYCMNCGAEVEFRDAPAVQDEDEFDPENRILCSDGTCTGIIIDGKCIVCGRPFKG